MSDAVTQGIRIRVSTRFLPERSNAQGSQFAFAYQIKISNEGSRPAKLMSRHWIITHGDGKIEEVRGDGVVGHQPRLAPGEDFEYTSWCMLSTPHGTMHGEYQLVRDDGEGFEAEIAPFLLAVPNSLN